MPETGLATDEKLQCISYSPFYHDGVTPVIISTHIEAEQIDSDLALLAQRFKCVRIYSVGQGLDHVPEAAKKLGLKVLLGVWIGGQAPANEKELKLGIKLANQYPDTIQAMIIGNEVLLRHEQTEAGLQWYLERAKKATKVPVTYADVWEYWLKHKNLEKSVDYVTVHILPYWEDIPQSVDTSMLHANIVMDKLAKNFSKPLFIGETGWPTVGRQRGPSIPSQLNQARYLREFVKTAEQKHWDYNLIEAIDQPWKRLSEGTVGGYWGLYDTELNPKFSFNGSVAERYDGVKPVYWALTGAILFVALIIYLGASSSAQYSAAITLGALAGGFAYLQIDYLETACRNMQEWIALGGINLVGWFSLLAILSLIANKTKPISTTGIRASLTLLLLGAAICGLLLSIDGRYRDFPIAIYLLPAVQLLITALVLGVATKIRSRLFLAIQFIAVITAAFCLLREPQNSHAVFWLAVTLLLTFSNKANKSLS